MVDYIYVLQPQLLNPKLKNYKKIAQIPNGIFSHTKLLECKFLITTYIDKRANLSEGREFFIRFKDRDELQSRLNR